MYKDKFLFCVFFFTCFWIGFFSSPLQANDQCQLITGIIEETASNNIILNGKPYKLANDSLIIFPHANGSELITSVNKIPPLTSAHCFLNSGEEITSIYFSGKFNVDYEKTAQQFYTFNGHVDTYLLSPNEKYLAYYSSQSGLL
jgi:hypothetical protein